MKKKEIIVVKEIGNPLLICTEYSDDPFEIDKVVVFLSEAKGAGANHIKITGEAEYDSRHNIEVIEIQPVMVREESDEEYNTRIAAEMQKELDIEKESVRVERATYEQLKKKYG